MLALGGLEEVGNAIGDTGRELFVLGQYGNERWTSTDRRVISPKPPRGLATFISELPRLLRRADAVGAWIEEKGLAVAVHTRRLEDPDAAYERLLPILTEAAKSHELDVEPGRSVIEIRAHGMNKGAAVRRLVEELGAKAVAFCGDDLGDVEAFKAVEELRSDGLPGPPGLLGVRRAERARRTWPTSWWPAPAAYSTCCGRCARTSRPPAPEIRPRSEMTVSHVGTEVRIPRRLPRVRTAHREGLRERPVEVPATA